MSSSPEPDALAGEDIEALFARALTRGSAAWYGAKDAAPERPQVAALTQMLLAHEAARAGGTDMLTCVRCAVPAAVENFPAVIPGQAWTQVCVRCGAPSLADQYASIGRSAGISRATLDVVFDVPSDLFARLCVAVVAVCLLIGLVLWLLSRLP